jgi:hypothetical protein
MALVRPAKTETSDGKFTGILPVCIWDFKDRSSEYDWADVFISVELDIQGSEYNRSLEICGGLERDSKGQVSGGHVLKPLYHLFDTLGFGGGLNAKGEWEDEDGVAITNIASHLNERYQTGNPIMDPEYKHVAYIYKAAPKQPGAKSYTRVFNRLYRNTTEDSAKLKAMIEWMTTRGYLKLDTANRNNGQPSKQPAMAAENL